MNGASTETTIDADTDQEDDTPLARRLEQERSRSEFQDRRHSKDQQNSDDERAGPRVQAGESNGVPQLFQNANKSQSQEKYAKTFCFRLACWVTLQGSI